MKELPIYIDSYEDKRLALLRGDTITNMLKRDSIYEKHFTDLVNMLVKEGDYVIDMGANIGYHTITLARLTSNSGKVFAFEPQRITYQQLNCNIILNGLDNVYAFNNAIGEVNSEIFIEELNYHLNPDIWTNIGNTEVNTKGIGNKIFQLALDTFDLPKINFIKMDVQGSELAALKGAKNSILKHKPILFVEMEDHHLCNFNTNSNELKDYIKSLGYNIFHIDYPISPVDHLCLPIGTPKITNYNYSLREV